MTTLKGTWLLAWDPLPDVIHDAFSNKRAPLKAVMTGMFPSAFSDLDSKLRTYKHYTHNPLISDEDAALIRESILKKEGLLVVAAQNYLLLDKARDGDDFGLSNPRESLSAFAWTIAKQDGHLDPHVVLDRLKDRYPPATTLKDLQRAINNPDVVSRVEAKLEEAIPYGMNGIPQQEEAIDRAVQVLMSSTRLAEWATSTEVPEDLHVEEAAWSELLNAPTLPFVHSGARGLGLAHQVPIPKTGMTEPAPRPFDHSSRHGRDDIMLPARQLELSLVDRLRRALDTNRESLEGLTPQEVLLDEVDRSISPLGLSTPGAQGVFVLLRAVALEIGRTEALHPKKVKEARNFAAVPSLPSTAVGRSFTGVFRKHKIAKSNTKRYARVGEVVLATLDDPTQTYISQVWGRVHGHEVRGTLDFTDLASVFGKVLLGVRESLLRSLGTIHDDAVLSGDPTRLGVDSPDRGSRPDDVAISIVDTATSPDMRQTLIAFLAALESLAQAGVDYKEVLRFVANADADPSYEEIWDRWSKTSESPSWLTFKVVVAVIPLMRQDVEDPMDSSERHTK